MSATPATTGAGTAGWGSRFFAVLQRIGRSLMARDEVVPVDEQIARIRAVTADDVAAVAARVYDSPRALAVVGHVDDDVLS